MEKELQRLFTKSWGCGRVIVGHQQGWRVNLLGSHGRRILPITFEGDVVVLETGPLPKNLSAQPLFEHIRKKPAIPHFGVWGTGDIKNGKQLWIHPEFKDLTPPPPAGYNFVFQHPPRSIQKIRADDGPLSATAQIACVYHGKYIGCAHGVLFPALYYQLLDGKYGLDHEAQTVDYTFKDNCSVQITWDEFIAVAHRVVLGAPGDFGVYSPVGLVDTQIPSFKKEDFVTEVPNEAKILVHNQGRAHPAILIATHASFMMDYGHIPTQRQGMFSLRMKEKNVPIEDGWSGGLVTLESGEPLGVLTHATEVSPTTGVQEGYGSPFSQMFGGLS